MNLYLRCLVLVFLFVLPIRPSAGTNSILKPDSWEAFEKDLLGVIPEEISATNYLTDYIFRLPAMQAIRDKGTPTLWMEMAEQGDFPLVATAGFLCVKAKQPEQAFEAALSVLSSGSTNDSNPFNGVVETVVTEYLSTASPSTKNLEVFTRFAQRGNLTIYKALNIWSSITNNFMSEWIERMPTTNAYPHLVAYIADSVILEQEQSKKPLSKKLSELLNSFENCADIRATIFVSHIKDDHPRLKEAMIRILKSEFLEDDDLLSPVFRHSKFIAKNIPYQDLNLRPRRIAIIERVISSKPSKKP